MNELRLLDGSTIAARNLFCIGRNYAEHAAELHNPVPTEPVVFLKPSSALLSSGGQIRLPVWSRDVQHEVELVVLLGEGGATFPTIRLWPRLPVTVWVSMLPPVIYKHGQNKMVCPGPWPRGWTPSPR